MFTEHQTFLGDRSYKIFNVSNIFYPKHMHHSYEVMQVVHGSILTKIGDREYNMKEGDCAVIFPLQYHSFNVTRNDQIRLYLFSENYIPEFAQKVQGTFPDTALFHPDTSAFLRNDSFGELETRAFFYRLCCEICSNLSFSASGQSASSYDVLDEIILYLGAHFQSDCRLITVAKELNYDYTYLSKLFLQKTGIPYNTYLNQVRINHACYLLADRKQTITQIAGAVGYNSIRTFNREFKELMNMTPAEYLRDFHP